MIDYNGNSDSDFDNNKEFIDIDLLCIKLTIQLLTYDYIACTKKRLVFETDDETNEHSKVKATLKKKIPI